MGRWRERQGPNTGRSRKAGPGLKAKVFGRDGYRCRLCGCGIGQVCDLHWAQVTRLDVAHVVPWAKGGATSLENLRVTCHPCNQKERGSTEGQSVFA